ncbi:MAG: NAD(P)-binding domain-containing protein [Akkermansiaceae bacterium]|nr:NAD(P)-binding domain-containing protein [Akkermansiaceae bacterium]
MTAKTIGFIGGGRVTGIILEGWRRQNALPANIMVSDCNAGTLAKLKERFPHLETVEDNPAAAAREIVFLAVHPPVMAEVAAEIKSSLKPGATVVSLAPKFTLAKLSEMLGGFQRLARVIPNAPSVVGCGFNPAAFAPGITPADKALLCALLEPLGEHPEVAESKLEGYALLTGMGPTYLWFQLQALREVAAGFGLDDAEIARGLEQMVGGAVATLLESGLAPAAVMDLIPVKPLAEMESQVTECYHTRLAALYQKIKP